MSQTHLLPLQKGPSLIWIEKHIRASQPITTQQAQRGRAENFCFPHSLMKLAWSLRKGLKENLVSLSVRVTVWTRWSQFRAAPGGIWPALLLRYPALGTLERVFLLTICCSHRHLQSVTCEGPRVNVPGEPGALRTEPFRPTVPSRGKI